MQSKYMRDKSVRFSDLIYAVLDRIPLLIAVAVLVILLVFALGSRSSAEKPSYMASGEIYVSASVYDGVPITFSEITLSDEALDKIIAQSAPEMDREELMQHIFVVSDQSNIIRFIVISEDEQQAKSILDAFVTTGTEMIEQTVPTAEVTLLRNKEKMETVHVGIMPNTYSTTYLSLKGLPTGSVELWDTYMEENGSTASLVKKGIKYAIVLDFLLAVALVIMQLFSRKVRYPEEFDEAGTAVLVTGDRKKQGLGALAGRLQGVSAGQRVLLFGSHSGAGTTTASEALAEALEKRGMKSQVVPAAEAVKEPALMSSEEMVTVLDGGAVSAGTAALEAAPCCDRLVMVTEPGKMDDIQIRRIAEMFEKAGKNIDGIVLNKAKVNQYGRRSRYLGTYFSE